MESEIAKKLLQIKAIKLSPQNPFTWASGIKSPIYCDNRTTLSYPEVRKLIIQGFVEQAKAFEPYDKVVGVATAGIPHGALLAHVLDKPFAYVRSKAKGHGRQNLIEGELKAGEKVLVIEDLISTGGSSLKAIKAVQEVGCEVVAAMAIFTYGFEKAQMDFDAAGIPLVTLSNYSALLDLALQENYISDKELTTLKTWRENPTEWNVNK